ncbi:MAG: DUF3843 family protein [Muribaculaceae bacterium]|nr:DUF3843 family protein [Muribaculaceae bacterium]
MEITVKDYMERQPGNPQVAETDRYYLWIAMRLAKLWDESPWLREMEDDMRRDVVLAVTGYFQDVVADGGLWRSFSRLHDKRHGSPVPHYGRSDDYVDYELNLDDVRFVIWWTIVGEGRDYSLDPQDEGLNALSTAFHMLLDSEYEQAPVPRQFCIAGEVDLENPADARRIYDYAYWLYWRSYLLRPSSLAVMDRAMPEAHALIARAGEHDARPLLQDLNDRLMSTEPAGPIPLTTAQWLRLIIDDVLPE